MKYLRQSILALSLMLLAAPVMGQGLTGYYQSLGLSNNYNTNVGFSNYSSSNTYAGGYQNYDFNSAYNNYNNVGPNFVNQNPSTRSYGGGLSAYYANNGIISAPGSNPNGGGFTQYFGQNLQANTFTRACPNVTRPDSDTCQGGSLQPITDNYGCAVEWRCKGGQFCPTVERPPASQCNGVWEPQYNAGTQCLTHYFCDRTPDVCTLEYQPVCGQLNGREITYSNRCFLNAAGAHFLYEGQCHQEPDLNPTPVINRFSGPQTLRVGETGTWRVEVRGSSQSQLRYSIDWGEQYDYAASRASNRQALQNTTFTHQYAQPGTYTVRVTVRNQHGRSATATASVRVQSQQDLKPSINAFTGPQTLSVGQTGTWRVSATHPSGVPVEFSINWGEAQPENNANRQIGPSYQQTFQNAYDRAGTYQVTVTARSGMASVSRSLTVRVTEPYPTGDRAPVIRGVSGPTTLNVDQVGTWRIQASDPQNQDLRYQINWGDQNNYGARAQYSGDAGFVQNSAFTHQYSTPGTYTVRVRVMNAAGKTAQTSITVRVNEDPIYRPYPDYPTENYSDSSNGYNYNSYNTYNVNSRYINRHSYFNRSYNWR